MNDADLEGMKDAIRADPLAADLRLIFADLLAEKGEVEEEAWHRWAATRVDGWRGRKEFVIHRPRFTGRVWENPKHFCGSEAALWTVLWLELTEPHAGEAATTRVGPELIRVADFDTFLRIVYLGHLHPVDIPREHCRRILREMADAEDGEKRNGK